jgi:hypothetical protein
MGANELWAVAVDIQLSDDKMLHGEVITLAVNQMAAKESALAWLAQRRPWRESTKDTRTIKATYKTEAYKCSSFFGYKDENRTMWDYDVEGVPTTRKVEDAFETLPPQRGRTTSLS